MQLQLAHTLAPLKTAIAPAAPSPTKLSKADLSGVIAPPRGASPGSPALPDTQHNKLVQQAQKWVAQTFFGTMLKQMRQSPFRSEMFDGGRGGQAFSQLYDQKLIDHLSRGAGKKLVNSLVRRLEAKAAYARHAGDTAKTWAGAAALNADGGGLPRHGGQDQPRGNPDRKTDNPFKNVRIHVSPAV